MNIAEGWYPDPEGKPCERYWDGSQWTEKTRPLIDQPQVNPIPILPIENENKKKIGCLGWTLIILISVFFIGYCTFNLLVVDTESPATTSEPIERSDSSSKVQGVDTFFVKSVRDGVGPSNLYYQTHTDQQLITWAKGICEKLESGESVEDQVEWAMKEIGDDSDGLVFFATLAGAGIAAYCPSSYSP
jgi:hypothetical protein